MTPFELVEPSSFEEALTFLDPEDPLSRPIAGGTALMLMMKSGVFHPSRLISLRRVEDKYSAISVSGAGELRVGAVATIGALERSGEVRTAFPVIADALRVLSNVRVRNVATVGGNLAHADPHMDLPPVLIALGAEVDTVRPSGGRRIAVEDLFAGYYETVLDRDELIGELIVPAQQQRRSAYIKVTTRSAHDWPALGVAVSVDSDGSNIRDARVVVSAATEKAMRLSDAEDQLRGAAAGDDAFRAAGEAAAAQAEVIPDVRGSALYKQQLIRVMVGRALRKALAATPGNGSAQ
jgi:carbon-monoxide dehydrogenase medium subunit